ncbi:MAG: hypothetical protein R2827_03520 [Bdellovibrionales bacterium]
MKHLLIIIFFMAAQTAFADYQQIVEELYPLEANGGHFISDSPYTEALTYDQEEEEVFKLKREIYDYGGCLDSRFNSINTSGNMSSHYVNVWSEAAIEHAYNGIKEVAGHGSNTEVQTAIQNLRQNLTELIRDEKNLLVLYSGMDRFGQDFDHSEGCLMYKFRIYRNDGKLIQLNFDFTD